jgi:thymidylate synthase (FAD)
MAISPDQSEELAELRRSRSDTLRLTVPDLEAVLYEPFLVLDHGFIRVVDYMGGDASIVQAARVSYGRGTRRTREDQGLIQYLMRHRHTTPFEMAEIKLHVKLPIFVARQWIRHRTANVNEYSARYSMLDKEFYLPRREHLAAQSSSNRQGRGDLLGEEEATEVLEILKDDAERLYVHYLRMLNENGIAKPGKKSRVGLARELARMNLSLNYYTQWYWKIDLHNLMNFLQLRADAHAQYEIRAYADVILSILQKWVPITYEAFLDSRLNAVTLSARAVDALRRALAGHSVTKENSGLSSREWNELTEMFPITQRT